MWGLPDAYEQRIKTSCRCGFEEAPGSLHILQRLNDVVSEYARLKGLTTVSGIGNDKYAIQKGNALSAYGYLSTLQKRNISMVFGNTVQTDLLKGAELFSVLPTNQGIVGERLVVNDHNHSSGMLKHLLVQQIVSLTYVIDETMSHSAAAAEKRASDTLHIRDIDGIEYHISPNASTAQEQQEAPNALTDNNSMRMG